MKKSFTLVEILIVVAILGILAAIALPQLLSHIQQAKESAAKDNLRILRNAIELYAAQHDGIPPGYREDNPSNPAGGRGLLEAQLVSVGHYLSKIPENPFSKLSEVKMIQNWDGFPAEPVEIDIFGWVYMPGTRKVKLNWPGTDSQGVKYFDY